MKYIQLTINSIKKQKNIVNLDRFLLYWARYENIIPPKNKNIIFAVGKKCGNAVKRNRIKRIIRDMLRLFIKEYKFFVIVKHSNGLKKKEIDWEQEFIGSIDKIHKILNKKEMKEEIIK